MISYSNLGSRNKYYGDLIQDAVNSVLQGGVFIGGKTVEIFENTYADFVGTTECVGVGNGLDALRLILLGLDIGKGDEVIVPAQTFIATWLAVSQTGATPVGVDVLSDSGNLDPSKVQEAITNRTRAVIVVHLHGQVSPLQELQNICDTNGLSLIEDAAQSHGAIREGKRAGSFGVAAAFSFYPTKNLGAVGDAGCVTTNDGQLAARIRSLSSYGRSVDSKYDHVLPGWNSRLDPIQAAVLTAILPHLDNWNASRRRLAQRIADLVNLEPSVNAPDLPPIPSSHVWHHFRISLKERDAFRALLLEAGIETEIHYPVPPHRTKTYGSDTYSVTFPVAEKLARTTLSLPLDPYDPHFLEEFQRRWTLLNFSKLASKNPRSCI